MRGGGGRGRKRQARKTKEKSWGGGGAEQSKEGVQREKRALIKVERCSKGREEEKWRKGGKGG